MNLWYLLTDLKVDVSVGQPAVAAFVQEVDVFNEETEEGNHNLKIKYGGKFTFTLYICGFEAFFFCGNKSCELAHLLLAAVCRLRPLGGAAERSAIVTKVTRRVHLVLNDMEEIFKHT